MAAHDNDALVKLMIILGKLVLTDSRTVYRTYDISADTDFAATNESAGADYNETSQELKQKQKRGEEVDFHSRGPPFVTIFVTVMHWAASLCDKEGVKQEKWMAPLREFYSTFLRKMSVSAVGELGFHWQWKRNKSKTETNPRGRLIFAFDMPHPQCPPLMELTMAMLETLRAERRIGPAPMGAAGARRSEAACRVQARAIPGAG